LQIYKRVERVEIGIIIIINTNIIFAFLFYTHLYKANHCRRQDTNLVNTVVGMYKT